jgi:uncharacterized membrane protein
MRTRLRYFWETLRGSFWFLPAILTVAAVALSFLTVALDRELAEEGELALGWTYRGGPDGARGVLSTIAASMITVAGVVFSITVVALTLASSQFGPRLLRNFIRDRGNQFVLGTFVATFVYCLLALRTVNGTEGSTFVPEVAVTVGVAMALISLGVLIYFIHHVAVSIQASNVVARVASETLATVNDLYPEELGEGVGPEADPPRPPPHAATVPAASAGYVLGVDADALLRLAVERDLVVYLPHPPGQFVLPGDPLMRVLGPAGNLDDGARDALRGAVVLGPSRTGFRDVEFALLQLTEIAVRALSPGVNDPFTAVECVDRIGEAFARLAGRGFPSPLRQGPDGRLRVVAPGVTFPKLLAGSFDPVVRHGRGSPLVLAAVLRGVAAIASQAVRPADRAALAGLVARVSRAADALPDPQDRADLRTLGGLSREGLPPVATPDVPCDPVPRNGQPVAGSEP